MIVTMLSWLAFLPAAILCVLPMKNQLRYGPGRTAGFVVLLFAVMIPLGGWLEVRFSLAANALTLPALVICFVLYHRGLRVHISKSIAVFAIVAAVMSVLSDFATGIDALYHPDLGSAVPTLEHGLAYFGLGSAAAPLLAWPLLRYGSRLIDQLDMPAIWYMTLPFSALTLVICLRVRPVYYETLYVNHVFRAYISLTTAMLLLWLLLLVMFYFIVTGILNAAKTEQRAHFLEMQESQFVSQQRYMEETSRQRHDFRQSIRTLTELYDMDNLEALGKHLHETVQSFPTNEIVHFCQNTALNALLNYYAHSADAYHIDFRFQSNLKDDLPISDVDLCSMIGNLLENAVTACQKVEKGFISLSVLTEENVQLYIVATNSFDGTVRQKDGRYLSTNRRGNGIGLNSVRTTAEKYGGVAQFSHEGKLFYSNIAIPLR